MTQLMKIECLKDDLDQTESAGANPAIPLTSASDAEHSLIAPASPLQPVPADIAVARYTAQSPRLDMRRLIDITGSAVLLIVFAPVLLVLALLVKLSDGGTPLFGHNRIGEGGRVFSCLKFRSMCVGAEARLKSLFEEKPELRDEWLRTQKLEDDPRVTPLGRFLRTTSMDELPQLINVLRGEMSLVGPRPIVSSELSQYGRFARYYLSVRPGLTGLWQVSGRSDTSYRRRVAADILYVRSRSLSLDALILFKTFPAVFKCRGSY